MRNVRNKERIAVGRGTEDTSLLMKTDARFRNPESCDALTPCTYGWTLAKNGVKCYSVGHIPFEL